MASSACGENWFVSGESQRHPQDPFTPVLMKLLELTSKLCSGKNVSNTLKQLLSLSQSSIAKQSEDADSVLENCKTFCIKSAASANYEQMAAAFKFVRKTCGDDNWLLAGTRIILPCLSHAYGKILATADPNKRSSPGMVSVAITPAIQGSKEALRGLCCIFELCIDFCDVIDSETEKHLGLFLRSSAAVLFGSNFQQYRDTLTDTDYAMDELARYSSYALCNILIAFPSLGQIADDILGKRTSALLNFLYSSPEMSIQRSLILILRVMYEYASKHHHSPRNLKSHIENGLSSTRFGNGRALELFKAVNIEGDDIEEEGERVIAKMFESEELDLRCFSCECIVRMSGKVNGRMRKGGTQKTKVDWNKNSVVVHLKNRVPAYFPIYAVTSMKWMSGHKEVRLTHRAEDGWSETQLAIELKPGNRGLLTGAIEKRVTHILNMVSAAERSPIDSVAPVPKRKLSAGWREQRGSNFCWDKDYAEEEQSNREDESEVDNQEDGSSDCELELDGTMRDVDEQCANIDSRDADAGKSLLPAEEDDKHGPTVFSIIDADGILLVGEQTESANEACQTSEDSDETKECSTPSSGEGEEIAEKIITSPQPGLPQTPIRAVPPKKSSDDYKPRVDLEMHPENAMDKMCIVNGSPDDKKRGSNNSVSDGELKPEVPNQVLSFCGKELRGLHEVSNGCEDIDESEEVSGIDDVQGDPNYNEVSDSNVIEPGNTCLRRKPAASDHEEDQRQLKKRKVSDLSVKTASRSIESSRLEESPTLNMGLCQDDERVRDHLLSAIRELMKVREKKTSKLEREAKAQIQQGRADFKMQDRVLLGKFARIVKQELSIQREKIAQYESNRKRELSNARNRLNALKRGLQEGLKRLRVVRSSCNREIAQAKTQMKRVRGQLDKDLDLRIAANRKKSSRKKSDCVVQGLAELLQKRWE